MYVVYYTLLRVVMCTGNGLIELVSTVLKRLPVIDSHAGKKNKYGK